MKHQISFTKGSRTYFVVFTTKALGDDQNTVTLNYGATVLRHLRGDIQSIADKIPGHFETASSRFERFPVETTFKAPDGVRTRGDWVNYFSSSKFQKMLVKKFTSLGVRIRHGGERSISLREKEIEQQQFKLSKMSREQQRAFRKASEHTEKASKDLFKGLMRTFAYENWSGEQQVYWARQHGMELDVFKALLESLQDPRGYQTPEESEKMAEQPIHYTLLADPAKPKIDPATGEEFDGARYVHIAYKRLGSGKMEFGATIYQAKTADDWYNYDEAGHWDTAFERLTSYPVKSYVAPEGKKYSTRSVTSGVIDNFSSPELWADLRKCVAKFGVRYRPGADSHRFVKSHELETKYAQQTKVLNKRVSDLAVENKRWNQVRSL